MNYGFFRVAAASLKLKVADPEYNKEEIKKAIDEAVSEEARLLVTPELSVTGYTCADLFFTKALQKSADNALEDIVRYTSGKNIAVAVGMPVPFYNSLYNCAVVIQNGAVCGIVPKKHIANYNEFYEKRWFASGSQFKSCQPITVCGCDTFIGPQIFDLGVRCLAVFTPFRIGYCALFHSSPWYRIEIEISFCSAFYRPQTVLPGPRARITEVHAIACRHETLGGVGSVQEFCPFACTPPCSIDFLLRFDSFTSVF